MSVSELVISSEEQAWELLKKALEDGIPSDQYLIKLEKWPILEFTLKGNKFDSSLTVKVMESFIALQQNINRAYAALAYNKPNALGLSSDQRKDLEIIVKVEKGSSLVSVDLQPAFETLLKGVLGKMTGTEMIIAILGTGLIAGGAVCFRAYLDHVRQQKQIDMVPLLSNNETERLKIFAKALDRQNKLADIYEDAHGTYDSFIRGATDAEYLEIGGRRITNEAIEDLMRQKRTASSEVQLNGFYRILSVDSSKPEGFKITVRSQDDNRTFIATLEDKWVFRRDANLELLKNAEWGKTPVYLRINGKDLRGVISHAIIIDVGNDQL